MSSPLINPIRYKGDKIGPDPRKCPIHKVWMKKQRCEQCIMAEEARQQHLKTLAGDANVVSPKVIIRKI